MKRALFTIFWSLALCAPFAYAEESVDVLARKLGLERLDPARDFEGGCGCSVWNARNETLLFSGPEAKAPATVRVDGQRRSLPFLSSTEKSGRPHRGDRFRRVYGGESVKLTLDYVTTFVCGPRDESCEVTRYRVGAILEQGPMVTRVKSLKGDCGC